MTSLLARPAPPGTSDHGPLRPSPSRSRLARTATVAVLVLVGLVFVVPLAWMVLASFKSTMAIVTETVPLTWRTFIPAPPTVQNFISIFTRYHFGLNLWNSAVVTASMVVGSVLTSTLAGYAFARLRFRGSAALFLLCLACAFVPMEAILLPEYRLVLSLGLNNTYLGAILPFMFSPFGIFLMRQSFRELPEEMFEAATLDGAGVGSGFWRIAVPNVGPAFVTLILVQFIWAWNAYIWPLLVLQDPAKQTAQVAAATFQSNPNHPMNGELLAASTAVTVPLVVLAIVLQKFYVRGLVMSGNK